MMCLQLTSEHMASLKSQNDDLVSLLEEQTNVSTATITVSYNYHFYYHYHLLIRASVVI